MKIAIDSGHSLNKYDYGAVGIKNESDLTREVGNKVIQLFKANGHEVINCTVDNCNSLNDSLYRRYNTANINNCDYYISIHFNAFNGSAKGTEILYYSTTDDKMTRILNNIVALGFTNRGLKQRQNLAVLKHTNMKSMLIECCFCDNTEDMNRFNADNVAKAIVSGFLNQNITNTTTANNTNTTNYSAHLRDWQSAYNTSYNANIYEDGIRGQQVEQAMRNAILKVGSKNSLVAWLQCRVGASIDCVYGQQTKQKVYEYQKAHNLVADGIVGYNTWNCLFNQYR